jgi:hypothetical protein
VVVVVADLSAVALRSCSWIRVIGMFGNETILDGSTFDDGNNGVDENDDDDDRDDDDDDDGTVDVDVDVSDVNERIECEFVKKKKANRRDQEEDCGWELSPCDGSRGSDDGKNGVKGVLRMGVAVVVGDADADDLTTAAIVKIRPNTIMEPCY